MTATPSSRPLALMTGASNGIGVEIARELALPVMQHARWPTARSSRASETSAVVR